MNGNQKPARVGLGATRTKRIVNRWIQNGMAVGLALLLCSGTLRARAECTECGCLEEGCSDCDWLQPCAVYGCGQYWACLTYCGWGGWCSETGSPPGCDSCGCGCYGFGCIAPGETCDCGYETQGAPQCSCGGSNCGCGFVCPYGWNPCGGKGCKTACGGEGCVGSVCDTRCKASATHCGGKGCNYAGSGCGSTLCGSPCTGRCRAYATNCGGIAYCSLNGYFCCEHGGPNNSPAQGEGNCLVYCKAGPVPNPCGGGSMAGAAGARCDTESDADCCKNQTNCPCCADCWNGTATGCTLGDPTVTHFAQCSSTAGWSHYMSSTTWKVVCTGFICCGTNCAFNLNMWEDGCND